MGTTDRIGLLMAYSSVQAHGSTALRVFTATWITASIHIMDTKARYPDVVRRHSIISRRMKRGTVAAMWSQRQATLAAENTRCLGTAAVVDAAKETVQLRRVTRKDGAFSTEHWIAAGNQQLETPGALSATTRCRAPAPSIGALFRQSKIGDFGGRGSGKSCIFLRFLEPPAGIEPATC